MGVRAAPAGARELADWFERKRENAVAVEPRRRRIVLDGRAIVARREAPPRSIPAITGGDNVLIVGCFMMGGLAKVEWNDFDEAFPAFIVMLSMPLTSSIATGIALGFITYPLLKIVRGIFRDVIRSCTCSCCCSRYSWCFYQNSGLTTAGRTGGRLIPSVFAAGPAGTSPRE